MRKKVFSLIFIFMIILGSSVYAVSPRNTLNNTSVNTEEATSLNTTNSVSEGENFVNNNTSNQESQEVSNTQEESGLSNHDIGLLAAALATGLACIGAGIAVAMVASSAIGAISENPSLLGKTIIFAGLAEGIAIYGLIISIMILNKI